MTDLDLNFHDTVTAFADKSNAELKQKYWLFKMMNSPWLVDFGTASTEFALSLGLPVQGMIKSTVFKQFCGGETIEECEPTIRKLGEAHIGTILDYSVEGKSEEAVFDHTKDEIKRTIARANGDQKLPFSVFKVTGLGPLGTLEKVSSKVELEPENREKWDRTRRRVEEICEYANSKDQAVFIDAEETWTQNAIDELALAMMERFNRERPLIFNTFQMYRTDRLDFLKQLHQHAKEKGYILGAKLVRGAYMEKERERAKEKGYPSPIQPDKAATDRDYDAAIDFCLENIAETAFVAGTHNENSVYKLAQKMREKGLAENHPHIFFSQLYGMSDNLSYILAKQGYNVSKYVPYGPVKDAVPYLIRRAKENTAITGQMSRELDLINQEMKRRKLG
ncbi:MAG TPA: proline dehydrogenase family protein [Pyrinomonadaceae bacterium]|jgi:proline dehydrogenase|nr:proline dehydrogenase family protein [Pyrinomonadaceae bacterium]